MVPPWLTATLGAAWVFPGMVRAAMDLCPARCLEVGPNPDNWSVYPDFKLIRHCEQTMFYSLSLYDPVDEPDTTHRIAACSSFGADFLNMPPEAGAATLAGSSSASVSFDLGWWHEGFGLAKPAIRSLVQQMREYINGGHGASSDRPLMMYGRSGQASIGVYIGHGLDHQAISDSALKIFENKFATLNVTTSSLAMQLCGRDYDSTQTFGVMVTSNLSFAPIQKAMQSWSNATCLAFLGSQEFAGRTTFTRPLLSNITSPLANSTSSQSNSTILARTGSRMQKRADCRTVQVVSGDGCAELASRCGISPADFTTYNPNICASLKPKQRVCCSSGSLPDVRPKTLSNGECFSYTVQSNDDCSSIAAEFGITTDEIMEFNKNTWGFSGCSPLFSQAIICLSQGNPPFPAPVQNAICGPQKPGSKPPTDGSKIADLNPCPLNACCNIWGQCGVTRDFCIDTNTGPPGTARAGTYGCISNCGIDVVKGTGTGAIKIAYFQGYGLGRPCLYQDALQIDASAYTHLHFGFGTLTPAYEVQVGDVLSSYQFNEFKRIRNAKRILSFGGWAFSNDLDTYYIFREGVKPANRLKMAKSIAAFIMEHDLDGVDIDWEYPGAPDLPTVELAGKAEDGPNYLAFLAMLKNLLPGRTVAIAAPASYWYLKQFPIKQISRVVDYIVYMTYDLHGQWDAHNKYSQENCDTGNCLRSQVNLTETRLALAMITKAGVPAHKVIVGVTSYGRSFQMAQPGCWGGSCKFTGDRLNSDATPGRCTGTAGYIADAEINEIISGGSGRVVTHFLDTSSNTDILVYDNNQWVGYMSQRTKAVRARLYAAWGMGGTTDWASDLQQFNEVPRPAKDWSTFISLAATGADPKVSDLRLGEWRSFTCMHVMNRLPYNYPPATRWKGMDADSAWTEVVKKWKETDKGRMTFLNSVEQTLWSGAGFNCDVMGGDTDKCDGFFECPDGADGPNSGPAAALIWESLMKIHIMYHAYYTAVGKMIGASQTTIRRMEDVFAPIPEPPSNQWLNVMIDLITVGALGSAAPFFNSFLKALPAMSKGGSTFDNTKDTALMLIGQGTTLWKDLLQSHEDDWNVQKQRSFSDYAIKIAEGWQESAVIAMEKLFDGSDESINALTTAVQEGKLIRGEWEQADDCGQPGRSSCLPPKGLGESQIKAMAAKAFFGFAVPGLWRRSGTYAFILDSGSGCSGHPSSKYVSDKTADATGVCYNDRLYYLVHPDGTSQDCGEGGCIARTFSAPPGLDKLVDNDFGGVTKEDIVKGSLATWLYNGRQNKPTNLTQIADKPEVRKGMAGRDENTPGLVQLPVCSPDRAFQSWDTSSKGSSLFYPCDIPPGRDHCGASTFVNQISDASPLIADCLQLIRNIEGDARTDWTHGIVGHRTVAEHATCRFGVEREGNANGGVQFMVGGQDVVDVIKDAISRFGGDGRVGAMGIMACSATTLDAKMDVRWGIF